MNQLFTSNQLITIAVSLMIGLVLGWLAALAINAAARTLGCLVVVVFVLIQILGYHEILHWNWAALLELIRPWTGVITDRLTPSLNAFTYNLPLSAGFLVGLLLGMRR